MPVPLPAREPKVFLAGRTLAGLGKTAEIAATGGVAETAQVDALDEKAIDRHANAVVAKAGSIDLSFNAIDIEGSTSPVRYVYAWAASHYDEQARAAAQNFDAQNWKCSDLRHRADTDCLKRNRRIRSRDARYQRWTP